MPAGIKAAGYGKNFFEDEVLYNPVMFGVGRHQGHTVAHGSGSDNGIGEPQRTAEMMLFYQERGSGGYAFGDMQNGNGLRCRKFFRVFSSAVLRSPCTNSM